MNMTVMAAPAARTLRWKALNANIGRNDCHLPGRNVALAPPGFYRDQLIEHSASLDCRVVDAGLLASA